MKCLRRVANATVISVLLLVGLSPLTNAHADDSVTSGPFAYITNYSSNNVSVIDTASDAVKATISTGLGPNGIALSSDGTRVYVANYVGNSVSVIDAVTNAVVATIPVSSRPYGIVVSPDGKQAYVTGETSNSLSVINTATNSVSGVIPLGSRPRGIVVSADGRRIYVANYTENTISVIDATVPAAAGKIALPANSNPIGLALSVDGNRLYATGYSSNSLYVIDTDRRTVTATIATGNRPWGVAVAPNQSTVYVANYSGAGQTSVSAVKVADNTVQSISLPTGVYPVGVSVHPDGGRIYVASYSDGSVYVINAASNAILGKIAVGLRPYALGSFISRPQPTLSLYAPEPNTLINVARPTLTFGYGAQCNGFTCQLANEYFNAFRLTSLLNEQSIGNVVTYSPMPAGGNLPGGSSRYTPVGPLPEGISTLSAQVTDGMGQVSNSVAATFTVDTIDPDLIVTSPGQTVTRIAAQTLTGRVSEQATFTVNGQYVPLDSSYNFSHAINLNEGVNSYDLVATDRAGNMTRRVVTLTLDSVSPAAPRSDLITISGPTNGSVTFVGRAGVVEPDARIVITNGRTGALVEIAAQSDGQYTTQIAAQQGDILTLVAKDSAGNSSAPIQRTIGSGDTNPTDPSNLLKILDISPANGATVNGNSVVVSGTFQGPLNTGITVNAVVAELDGNRFYAQVPLESAANTLTVIGAAPNGQMTTSTLNVISSGTSFITITPYSDSSDAPRLVSFKVNSDSEVTIKRIEVDYDGDGTIDSTTDDLMNVSLYYLFHTYTIPGVYQAHFKLTDSQNNVSEQTIVIAVRDPAKMDQFLKTLWSGMNDALISGDTAKALSYLHPQAQAKYGPVFTALAQQMPAIVASYSPLQKVSLLEEVGEYAINRMIDGEDMLFFIYFLRGGDGVWYLDSM